MLISDINYIETIQGQEFKGGVAAAVAIALASGFGLKSLATATSTISFAGSIRNANFAGSVSTSFSASQ